MRDQQGDLAESPGMWCAEAASTSAVPLPEAIPAQAALVPDLHPQLQ